MSVANNYTFWIFVVFKNQFIRKIFIIYLTTWFSVCHISYHGICISMVDECAFLYRNIVIVTQTWLCLNHLQLRILQQVDCGCRIMKIDKRYISNSWPLPDLNFKYRCRSCLCYFPRHPLRLKYVLWRTTGSLLRFYILCMINASSFNLRHLSVLLFEWSF